MNMSFQPHELHVPFELKVIHFCNYFITSITVFNFFSVSD